MFSARWRLCRVSGIPIYVDASWLVILALVTWTLADLLFPRILQQQFPNTFAREPPGWQFLAMGLVAALAFFVCILLHELGHATVGRALGMSIRGITLFLFGGVAELADEPPSAGSEFLMAIAGPVVSLFLAGVFGVAAMVGSQAGWPPQILVVLGYLAAMNGMVLAFNLVPAFPLDGGRVFRSILWGATGSMKRATYWASLLGQAFAWLLIAYGVFSFFNGDIVGGIWSAIIGMFLNGAARSSYQQVLIRQALQGEPVRRFMNEQPVMVPPSVDLRHWVEDFVYRYHYKLFPVASDGKLEGFISTRALTQFPREEWERHTVGEAMRQDVQKVAITPQADAMQALGRMQRTGLSRLLVVEGDRLVGVITLKDLLRFLHDKLELEDEG